uniref:Uncharacterized protein n=1 Tax=Anguilla anguilla TaxID=7936 RepID=A0A0E9SVF2_ANGAN
MTVISSPPALCHNYPARPDQNKLAALIFVLFNALCFHIKEPLYQRGVMDIYMASMQAKGGLDYPLIFSMHVVIGARMYAKP